MPQLSDLFSQSPLEFCREFVISSLKQKGNSFSEMINAFSRFRYSKLTDTNLDCKIVEQIGGYEGGGEYVDWVFEFTKDENSLGFLRFTGFYDSEDGITWDEELTVVIPKQVIVTQYVPKQVMVTQYVIPE